MNIHTGIYIESTPALEGTVFENAVIYITEHNSNGATGFIINKQFGRALNELEEFRHSAPFPLHEGGPVDNENIFFIHRRADIIPEGTLISDDVYMGGNFKQAVTAINNKTITSNDIKIFVGYCGWNNAELEAEIEEGSWRIIEQPDENIFFL